MTIVPILSLLKALEKGLVMNVTKNKTIRLLPPLICKEEHVLGIADLIEGLIKEKLMNKRHLRSLIDINEKEFIRIIDKAIEYKKLERNDSIPKICTNKTLAMIFKKTLQEHECPLKTAMFKLGGHAIFFDRGFVPAHKR